MNIGELSATTGIAASAIRYYEEQGLLPRVQRESGRRVFGDADVARLAFVQVAKDAGFSLKEIRQLIRDFKSERWRTLARRKLDELAELAARLRLMQTILAKLLECGCFDVEACGAVLRQHRARLSTRARSPR